MKFNFGLGIDYRDVSFFLCVGGCNFPAEIVSKNFLPPPPAEYTLKIAPQMRGILSRVFDRICSDRRSLLRIAGGLGDVVSPRQV